MSYRKALEDVNLKTPLDEREEICANLFNQISESDGKLKLTDLLPARNNASQYKLRNNRMFATPGIKTKRLKNFLHNALFSERANVNLSRFIFRFYYYTIYIFSNCMLCKLL